MKKLPPARDQDIGDALVESVGATEALDVIKDLGEVALDSALDEGTLRDLPVIGWVFGGARVVRQLKDRLFLKKLAAFLTPISRVSPEARREFMNRMNADPRFKQRVGDGLVLLLDRHEHFEKSEVLGLVFRVLIRNEIGFDLYQTAATVIDRASTNDFKHLASQSDSGAALKDEVGQALTSIGAATSKHTLVHHTSEDGFYTSIGRDVSVSYELNVTGKLLSSVLRDWGT